MKKTVFLLAFLFQFVIIYPIYGVVGVSNVSCSAGSGDGNDLYKETNYTVSFDWTKDQYNSLYYAICLSTTTTHHWESGSGSSDYWLTSTGGTGSSCVYENGCTGSDNGYTVVHTDFGTGISTEGTSGSEEVTINVPSSVSNGDYYIVVVVKQDIIQVTEYNNDYDGESSTSNYLLVLVTGGTRRTWDGGGIDNNWNTPDNWSDNILPTSKDTAYFDITSDKNCIINNSTTVHTIIFTYDYTGTFNIQNATLIVNGDADFSSGGLIESFDGILEFNGDGSQLFNTGSFYSPNILVNGAADVLVSTGTDIYINSLTINEGAAFTCPSYNHMHISGGFINNGIFNHNNGTVVFDSSSGSHVIDPGGNPFNNIRIGYGGSTADWTLMSSLTADTLVVEYATLELGNFTHNISVFSYGMMGTLNFNACTLKVTGDADFSGLESINAGNGLLEFAGSAAQNLFLNSLNLPSVIHTGSDTLSLNNNNLDAAAFSQSAGFLNFNGFDIHVTGDFIITNGTSSIFLGLDGVTISAGGKASFSGQNGNLLNMNPSTLWYLHVSNELTAEYASIGNCDASGFSQGIASNSVDNGGNENWVFNDAPTDISISSSDIDENEPIGTMVGTFSTTDENTGDIHIYSLVAGTGDDDNSRFTIDIDSLKTASVFDYEIKSSYNIRLRTDDGHSGLQSLSTIAMILQLIFYYQIQM